MDIEEFLISTNKKEHMNIDIVGLWKFIQCLTAGQFPDELNTFKVSKKLPLIPDFRVFSGSGALRNVLKGIQDISLTIKSSVFLMHWKFLILTTHTAKKNIVGQNRKKNEIFRPVFLMKCTQLYDISDSHLANYIFLGLETSNSLSFRGLYDI